MEAHGPRKAWLHNLSRTRLLRRIWRKLVEHYLVVHHDVREELWRQKTATRVTPALTSNGGRIGNNAIAPPKIAFHHDSNARNELLLVQLLPSHETRALAMV